MESSSLNAVRKDAAQRARDFLVAALGYLYVELKRQFSNLEVSSAIYGRRLEFQQTISES